VFPLASGRQASFCCRIHSQLTDGDKSAAGLQLRCTWQLTIVLCILLVFQRLNWPLFLEVVARRGSATTKHKDCTCRGVAVTAVPWLQRNVKMVGAVQLECSWRNTKSGEQSTWISRKSSATTRREDCTCCGVAGTAVPWLQRTVKMVGAVRLECSWRNAESGCEHGTRLQVGAGGDNRSFLLLFSGPDCTCSWVRIKKPHATTGKATQGAQLPASRK